MVRSGRLVCSSRRRQRRCALVTGGQTCALPILLNWIPAFLMRTQGMPLDAMATWFAPAAGITFGIGILGGGWLVSHAAKRSPRAYGSIPALATAVLIPTFAAALLVDTWQVSLALLRSEEHTSDLQSLMRISYA